MLKVTTVNDAVCIASTGFGVEALLLLGVGYTHDTVTAFTCLTIAVGFSGFAISGQYIHHFGQWGTVKCFKQL